MRTRSCERWSYKKKLRKLIDDANKELRKVELQKETAARHGKLMKRFEAKLRKLKERVATYTEAKQSRMEAEHSKIKRKRHMMKIALMNIVLHDTMKRDMEEAKAKH